MATPKKKTTTAAAAAAAATTTTIKPTTGHQKCQIIFNGLLQMLRTQSSQYDSLLEDRQNLQQHLKIVHNRWVSDVGFYDEQITMLVKQISLFEMSKSVEKARSELFLGSKKRELLICQRKLENLESELDDFKAWFDILSHRSPNKQDISPDEIFKILKAKDVEVGPSNGSSMHRCKELEKEVATLKCDYEKLSVEKSSSESALQAEINFVWNQYKKMESNYIKQLLNKSNEVHEAKEEVNKLLADIKQLQSSMEEKDISVETLKADITLLKDGAGRKDGEVKRLTKELESLKSRGSVGKPILHHCSSKSSSSRSAFRSNSVETLKANISNLESEARQKDREIARLIKELESIKSPALDVPSRATKSRGKGTDLKAEAKNKNEKSSTFATKLPLSISKSEADSHKRKHCELSSSSRGKESKRNKRSATSLEPAKEQVPRRSPRKWVSVADIDATPKLFTSQFKVPKLKAPSPFGS